MKRKPLSLFLALCLVICLLPRMPFPAEASVSNSTVRRQGDWSYDIAGAGMPNPAAIIKYHGSASNVTIPSQLGGWTIGAVKEGTFSGNTTVKTITVPSSLTTVYPGAFKNCTSLERVNLPTSYTTIHTDSLFDGCTNLKYVNLPESIEEIGSYAFRNCTSLTSITLPESLRTISYDAFWKCSSLTEIHLGASVSEICDEAFAYCTSLQRFTVDAANRYFSTDSNGVLFSKGGTTLYIYPGGRTGSYTVPEDVTEIDSYAFKGSLISEVHFASEYTELGLASFEDCTRLTYAEIPEAEWNMQHTFEGCTALRSISIPDGADVSNSVFANCTSLREVTFEGNSSCAGDSFTNVTATVYYPADLVYEGTDTPVWTESDFQDYGGSLTWVPYCSGIYHIAETGTVLVEPTCISNGSMDAVCELCGEAFVKTLLPTAHPFEYEAIVEASCTRSGVLKGTCSYCGETETKTVPPLPHDIEGREAIHLDGQNMHYYLCNTCGGTGLTEYCTTTGFTITRQPSLTQIGLRETVCAKCNYTTTDGIAHRISGETRFETAFAIADALKALKGLDRFRSVVLASGLNFPDALAGSYLAIAREAPILLVNETAPDTLLQWLQENLAPDGTAYILGGNAAVSEGTELMLISSGITTHRLAGEDRFGTNLEILKQTGVTSDTILVCTGTNFADSLSASAAGLPILLVNPYTSQLTQDQTDYLTALAAERSLNFCIIGGASAVPTGYESILASFGGTVTRLSGSSRDETSRKFADTFCSDARGASLTNALNFPDGLCGGPLAYALDIPLLLVCQNAEREAEAYVDSREEVSCGIVFGGFAAVRDEVADLVFRTIN